MRSTETSAGSRRGRPRDEDLDRRILEVTIHHLARVGYPALSLVAVARDAGTTRQAVYRRWSGKADLATAAIASLAAAQRQPDTDDPFEDLVTELSAFRRGVSRPDGLAMVGTMLVGSTDPELIRAFRQRIVHPRRARFRALLQRALADGRLAPDADIDLAVSTLTGSWYALALAGERPPRDWARRIARLTWIGLGGQVAPEGEARLG